MSFIGYNSTGYSELAAEIRTRKSRLLDILNSFPEVENAISDRWKGEDATANKDELSKEIKSKKESVTTTYEEKSNKFKRTYNDWVEKQRTSGM